MVRLWLSVLLVFSWSPAILAQDLSLGFDRFSPTKETSVGFSIHDGGSVPSGSLAGFRTADTQRGLYTLAVDTTTFEQHGTIFSFDTYVYLKNAATAHKYVVSEDPIGAFRDGIFNIPFRIQARNGEQDAGTINLPLHSNDGSDNLALALPKDSLKIGSGNASQSDLGLTNQLENLHVQLLEIHISSTSCENCWRSLSVKTNLDVLAPKKGTSLIVNRQPNTIKALLKSMSMLNPGVVHDTLLVTISSISEQGGLPSPQEFRLPVTFTPPGAYLLLAVLVGAALGSGLRLAVKPKVAPQPAAQPAQPAAQPAAGGGRLQRPG
jgi:hypothetical protein